jgi:hypothetical protein
MVFLLRRFFWMLRLPISFKFVLVIMVVTNAVAVGRAKLLPSASFSGMVAWRAAIIEKANAWSMLSLVQRG